MEQQKKLIDGRSLLIAALTTGIVIFTLLGYRFYSDRNQGEALIGGHFELTNQNGENVTEANYRGKYMLVFFGYTSCPDICPVTLQEMTAALDQLGGKAQDFQPIFISVDPERDNVAHLKEYIGNFHPSFAALTGDKAKIEVIAKAYRVFYQPGQTEGLIDHSSVIYLMDKEGRYLKHFSANANRDEIYKGLSAL